MCYHTNQKRSHTMKNTIIGVDLAKNVIQICVVKNNKVISNKEIQANDFEAWLATSKKATVVFEACATSNYWKQTASKYGHDSRIISAKLVSKIRQHQKTDKKRCSCCCSSESISGYSVCSRQIFCSARAPISDENARTCSETA